MPPFAACEARAATKKGQQPRKVLQIASRVKDWGTNEKAPDLAKGRGHVVEVAKTEAIA